MVTLPQRALDDLSQQRLRFFGPEIAQGPSQLNGDRQFVFGALAGAGRQPQDGQQGRPSRLIRGECVRSGWRWARSGRALTIRARLKGWYS